MLNLPIFFYFKLDFLFFNSLEDEDGEEIPESDGLYP